MKTLLKYLFPAVIIVFLAGCKKEKNEVDTVEIAGKYAGEITVSYSIQGIKIQNVEDSVFPNVEITLVSTAPDKVSIAIPETANSEDIDFPEISSSVSLKNGVYVLSGNTEIILPEPVILPETASEIRKINAVTSGSIDRQGNINMKIEFKVPVKVSDVIDVKVNYVITMKFVGKKTE